MMKRLGKMRGSEIGETLVILAVLPFFAVLLVVALFATAWALLKEVVWVGEKG